MLLRTACLARTPRQPVDYCTYSLNTQAKACNIDQCKSLHAHPCSFVFPASASITPERPPAHLHCIQQWQSISVWLGSAQLLLLLVLVGVLQGKQCMQAVAEVGKRHKTSFAPSGLIAAELRQVRQLLPKLGLEHLTIVTASAPLALQHYYMKQNIKLRLFPDATVYRAIRTCECTVVLALDWCCCSQDVQWSRAGVGRRCQTATQSIKQMHSIRDRPCVIS